MWKSIRSSTTSELVLKSCAHRPESCSSRVPSPSSSLPTQALVEEILEDGPIFALSSPFGLGKSCLRLVFNLQYFNNAIYALAHTYIVYFLITIFQWRKFWTRKFWRFCGNSPNSPKFSPSKILYRTVFVSALVSTEE